MQDSRNGRYFAHEKLDAYRLAVEALRFVAARRNKLRGLPGNAGPQLERAVMGALTAIGAAAPAEGAERLRLYRGGLAEASEAGCAIDAALVYGAFSADEHRRMRELLLRLCSCLFALAHP
jgi:hypothetical protein